MANFLSLDPLAFKSISISIYRVGPRKSRSRFKIVGSPRKNRVQDDEMTDADAADGLVRGELIPDSTHTA